MTLPVVFAVRLDRVLLVLCTQMAGYRNYGSGVSESPQTVVPGGGSYSAEDHSFELVVFQSDEPAADWEFNLFQDIINQKNATNKIIQSSGFLTGDFNETYDGSSSFSFLTPDPPTGNNANKFNLAASDLLVNGWPIRFEYSNSATAGVNEIQLPNNPVLGNRIELVILEFWRALISASPDSTNKSPAGQIFRFGNAKSPDVSPGNANLNDDLIDPTYTQATSKRIQIQYRYRVVTANNLATYSDGLGDPSIVATTVPYKSGSDADGAVTGSPYPYVPVSTDSGLWIAGNGDSSSATDIGTVDGYMYATPVCAVFRRNSSAFDRLTNTNGGGNIATSFSGRPDGLYCDQIVLDDIKDLRKSFAGDFTEILDKSMDAVFSNNCSTQFETIVTGEGVHQGASLFVRADIGGGTRAVLGSPDGIRMVHSGRRIAETTVASVTGTVGTTVVFDLASLTLATGLTVDATLFSTLKIIDVPKVRIVDPAGSFDKDGYTALSPYVNDLLIDPSGTFFTITFDSALTGSETVYAEIVIEYPENSGLPRNILSAHDLWTPPAANIAAWVEPADLTATSDANRYSLDSDRWWVDKSHRELTVRLKSIDQVSSSFVAEAPGLTSIVYIPEIVVPGSVSIPGKAILSISSNTSYTAIEYSPQDLVGTAITVTYKAFRALPPVSASPGDSYQFWYSSRAIQSILPPAGVQTLQLTPRAFGKSLYVVLNGSGSPDSSFPIQGPGVQFPVGTIPSPASMDTRLDSPNAFSISGFSMESGYGTLPLIVPMFQNPGQMTLYKDGLDTVTDDDLRNFWPKSSSSLLDYFPSVHSTKLVQPQRHKVAYPILCELKQDFDSIGRKGTFVLVVMTQWYEFSKDNSFTLTNVVGDAAAAVFRVCGNPMNTKRNHS